MSDPQPEPTEPTEPDPQPEPSPAGGESSLEDQLAQALAERDKWKAQSKKHEDRSKANKSAADELAELKRANMTEVEAATAKAREDGKLDALREVAPYLVRAEVRAQSGGRPLDVDALVEGMDAAKFLDEDGAPDGEAIAAWLNRVAPPVEEEPGPSFPDLGQGPRGFSASDDKSLNGDPLLRGLKSKLGIR